MPSTSQNSEQNFNLGISEIVLGATVFSYFLFYPRDTLFDFIILTILCIILLFGKSKIGLYKPKVQDSSKIDILFAVISAALFISAWSYGFLKGKINYDSALTSIFITSLYFYYALIQHFLAQQYLASRMLQFSKKHHANSSLPFGPQMTAALMTGFIFSILHIPYPHLMLPTALIGFLYAYYYLTTGRFWAVVVSHALISSTILFWLLDDHPFTELTALFQ